MTFPTNTASHLRGDAEILPSGEECLPVHVRRLYELVHGDLNKEDDAKNIKHRKGYTDRELDVDVFHLAGIVEGKVEVRLLVEVRDTLDIDHLLELRPRLHSAVHLLHLGRRK